jgi:hypothetical protein
MIATQRLALVVLLAVVALASAGNAAAQQSTMTFFVTSSGLGKGADLGGVAGADAHCQAQAQAAGAGNRGWRAYLSLTGASPINARDPIGAAGLGRTPKARSLPTTWRICTAPITS